MELRNGEIRNKEIDGRVFIYLIFIVCHLLVPARGWSARWLILIYCWLGGMGGFFDK